MTESGPPRILILQANDGSRERARQILEDQGWDVTCETVSKQALDRLKQSRSSPFHIFISHFRLPKMGGDDILQHAKAISPLTQRMLMVPSDETEMVIRAINKAEINGCIITPATAQDLENQVKTCLAEFDREMKHEQLKRVINHQNKQMFVIARRLKKKAGLSQDRIAEQKAEKLRLMTELGPANQSKGDWSTLGGRLRSHGIPITPQALEEEFRKLAGFVQALFRKIAGTTDLAPPSPPENLPAPAGDGTEPNSLDQLAGPVPDPQAPPELVDQLLKTVFACPAEPVLDMTEPEAPADREDPLDLIQVRITPDRTRAFVKINREPDPADPLTLDGILELLRLQEISFGIAMDEDIESWIRTARPGDDEFIIARGQDPVPGRDGEVAYYFTTDYTNPGKIMEDGRIDFRDRGEIPFASQGDILAVKTPAREGKPGMSISGEVIQVEAPLDPVFCAGSGTGISEDGLTIQAALNGQPHLDPLGEISVNPELPIDGDVDYETGNIEFNGNIIVAGTVKEGFTVKGVNLTAKEIEGAVINLTGDLNISDGITDATIESVGNVHAKFINNSTVYAFGNVVVQKEIIDSTLLLSGRCENPTGVIISSGITAKTGVQAGRIGTDTSKPSMLKVGVDDHVETRIKDVDTRLETSLERLRDIREEIELVENQDQALYAQITEKAQEQERIQSQIKALDKDAEACMKRNDIAGADQARTDLAALSFSLKKADQELNAIFEVQDNYAKKIESNKGAMDRIEQSNKDLVLRKKGLREFSRKTAPEPQVIVQGSITQETAIIGPNTSLTMKEDQKRCRIVERSVEEDGIYYSEMSVQDL